MVFASLERLLSPQPIHYEEAIWVACVGLAMNVVCALILGGAHHDHRDADEHRPHLHASRARDGGRAAASLTCRDGPLGGLRFAAGTTRGKPSPLPASSSPGRHARRRDFARPRIAAAKPTVTAPPLMYIKGDDGFRALNRASAFFCRPRLEPKRDLGKRTRGATQRAPAMLVCEEYLTPESLNGVFAAMERHRGRCRIVAGCTDVLPWAREGQAGAVDIPVLIDVTRVPELRHTQVDGRRVRLGAATPVQRLVDDCALAGALPSLPYCAAWFADEQIRAQATVGGNIVNASPAADLTAALLAYDADVELATQTGGNILRRRMKLDRFVIGPRRTALEQGELLIAIECDALPEHGGSFEKIGYRRSLVVSIVSLAALVKLDAQGRRFEDVRLALGGIGPAPRRLSEVEAFLRGGPLNAARLEEAAKMPLNLVASRTRQAYRREVVHGFMLRGLIHAARRAGADGKAFPLELEAAYG
jgi:xanthine dehydrogenase FAD-binding subunit